MQYHRSEFHHSNTSLMQKLKSNFDKFLDITKYIFIDRFDNFFSYRNQLRLSDGQIIALALQVKHQAMTARTTLWLQVAHDNYCQRRIPQHGPNQSQCA